MITINNKQSNILLPQTTVNKRRGTTVPIKRIRSLNHSSDISFKGSIKLIQHSVGFNNYNKLIQIFDTAYDGTGQKLLTELSDAISQKGARLHKEADKLIIEDKSFFQNLAESALFPFTKLPLHLLNSLSKLGRKIPFTKKGAEKIYNSSILTKFRHAISVDSKTDMLRGILKSTKKAVQPMLNRGETLDSLLEHPEKLNAIKKELFRKSNRFFNRATGNYNTAYERPLNRLVTGLIPAAFLANDAYNLAIMCGDDKEESSKEAESRKRQEVFRVFTNAYIQLVTLGTFTKLINSNATASALISAATVLVAETVGRLANSRPIFFLSKDKAKAFNKKLETKEENKEERKSSIIGIFKKDKKETKAAHGVNIEQKPQIKQQIKSEDNKSFKGKNKKQADKPKDQRTVITFETLKKAVIGLSAGGLALAFLKNSTILDKNNSYKAFKNSIKSVGDFFTENIYNKLCKKDFSVDVSDFNKTMDKLEEVGLKNIASTYKDIAGDLTGKSKIILKNGEKVLQTKTKAEPYVNAAIQPFKFLISVVTLPYRIIKGVIKASTHGLANKIKKGKEVGKIGRGINKVVTEIFGSEKDKKPQSLNDIFAYSIPNLIQKARQVDGEKLTNEEFKDFVQSSIQRSFNTITQSKNSNTDLAMMTKLASSTVTSAFLIADNYNMVMLKSDGEDKENALQKAKERAVQRISGIFYQTLFMKWFNSTFESIYHKSLLGMSMVAGTNTVATEFFTRKSIGMPIGRKTEEELIALDEKNLSRKGLAGKYFRFMSMLTGKKSLGERVAEKNKKSGKIQSADNKTQTTENPVSINYIPSNLSKLK